MTSQFTTKVNFICKEMRRLYCASGLVYDDLYQKCIRKPLLGARSNVMKDFQINSADIQWKK